MKKTEPASEHVGCALWWSTFHQKWNITPWMGCDYLLKEETTRYNGKPICSEAKLLKYFDNTIKRKFPEEKGKTVVVEPGYSVVWGTTKEMTDFLAENIQRLVCSEL